VTKTHPPHKTQKKKNPKKRKKTPTTKMPHPQTKHQKQPQPVGERNASLKIRKEVLDIRCMGKIWESTARKYLQEKPRPWSSIIMDGGEKEGVLYIRH